MKVHNTLARLLPSHSFALKGFCYLGGVGMVFVIFSVPFR